MFPIIYEPVNWFCQQAWGPVTILKRDSNTGVFLLIWQKFLKNTYFEKDLRMAAFVYLSCLIYYHFPNSYRIITVQLSLLRDIFCVVFVDNKS